MRWIRVIAFLFAPVGALIAQAPPTRWSVEVRGPAATIERGELRLNGAVGRLLMESADSAFTALDDLQVVGGRITFTAPAGQRRFEGTIAANEMYGLVLEPDGRTMAWTAELIPPGIQRWPVRPRVVVRQLAVGSAAKSTAIAEAWHAAGPTPTQLAAEYHALTKAAGVTSLVGPDLARRMSVYALGFDRDARRASRVLLERIAAGPAADREFTQIFRGPGGLRVDLHDIALQVARGRTASFDTGAALRALATLQLIPSGDRDTVAMFEGAWRLWSRAARDSAGVATILDSLAGRDAAGASSVRALLGGYNEAVVWWPRAVGWLLVRRWIELPGGAFQSPAGLVADFWGRPTLPLPAIDPIRFGGVQAVPVIGVERLGATLVRAQNASGAEWLAKGGVAAALDAWRQIDAGDQIVIDADGRRAQLTAPAAIARTRLGGFFAAHDAIRIEPGIAPILAVATAIHEWHHILFETARLEGTAPGVHDDGIQLRIIESDPWLSEGAAEWATELTLAPLLGMTPLLALMESEKRAGIRFARSDDPHVLGYLLVRASASRVANPAVLRDRLVRLLHDPAAFAVASGFARAGSRSRPLLWRPATLAVIPEITFTWDDGVADRILRRLLVPAMPMER